MSSESSNPQTIALATLSLLETRLRRVEFLLTGSSNLDGGSTPVLAPERPVSSKDTITGRLQQLQDDLNRLRKLPGPEGDLIRDVESLHNLIPEIFDTPLPNPQTSLPDQTIHIFANTSLYPETASRLSSLQTLTVPPAEQSSQLIDLQPRINAAKAKQEELEIHSRELRERSVRCLEWWLRFGVVGMGEMWSEWEERVKGVEREVGRFERGRREREGYV